MCVGGQMKMKKTLLGEGQQSQQLPVEMSANFYLARKKLDACAVAARRPRARRRDNNVAV